jgi:hypothetical protein
MAWFSKKIIERNICVLIFPAIFYAIFSILKKNRARCNKKIYIGRHIKYPLFLLCFNDTWFFSTNLRNPIIYQFPRISVHWEPNCFLRTDGEAYVMKRTVTFRNFAKGPKNRVLYKAKNSLNRRKILILRNTLVFSSDFLQLKFRQILVSLIGCIATCLVIQFLVPKYKDE